MAYVSIVEPRVSGIFDVTEQLGTNEFVYKHWKGTFIRAGAYAQAFNRIEEDIQNDRTLIAFSRFFTSNPDLVQKLKDGTALTPYNRDEFYKYYNYGYNSYEEDQKKSCQSHWLSFTYDIDNRYEFFKIKIKILMMIIILIITSFKAICSCTVDNASQDSSMVL